MDWPCTHAFRNCPDCGQPTWVDPDGKPRMTVIKPEVIPVLPPHEQERQIREFAEWLETVTPEDFCNYK